MLQHARKPGYCIMENTSAVQMQKRKRECPSHDPSQAISTSETGQKNPRGRIRVACFAQECRAHLPRYISSRRQQQDSCPSTQHSALDYPFHLMLARLRCRDNNGNARSWAHAIPAIQLSPSVQHEAHPRPTHLATTWYTHTDCLNCG